MSKLKTAEIKKKKILLKNEIGYYLGIFSSVIAIFELFTNIPVWFRIIWLSCVGFFIVKEIVVLVRYLIENFSIKSELNKTHILHVKAVASKVNDCITEINKETHSKPRILADKNTFSTSCKNISNEIEKVFSTLWDDSEVSVCFKKIVVNDINDDVINWETQTIARSTNTKRERKLCDSINHRIFDNKDFYVIASSKFPDYVFSSPNLENIKKDFPSQFGIEYENSTTDYIKHYRSTIVVPIRIVFDKAHKVIRNLHHSKKPSHNIIGFLCIDSMKTFDNDLDIFKAGTELAVAFGDALYDLFEKNYVLSLPPTTAPTTNCISTSSAISKNTKTDN